MFHRITPPAKGTFRNARINLFLFLIFLHGEAPLRLVIKTKGSHLIQIITFGKDRKGHLLA